MLKFIVGDKLIIVEDEKDMFISHLLSFRYIEVDGETLEIPFRALEIMADSKKQGTPKNEKSISSWGKSLYLIKSGDTTGWGKMSEPLEKKDRLDWVTN